MIFDKIENAENYYSSHPLFKEAFAFLKKEDIASLPPETYEIKGRDIYAMISSGPGKKKEEAKLETHRKYIDIQFLLEGEEQIGWKAYGDCSAIRKEYNAEKDIEFYNDEAQTYLNLAPKTFAVFYPGDAHAPMISDGNVHKVILKILA
jgi:YhcH/YjgK/YiaL family protein